MFLFVSSLQKMPFFILFALVASGIIAMTWQLFRQRQVSFNLIERGCYLTLICYSVLFFNIFVIQKDNVDTTKSPQTSVQNKVTSTKLPSADKKTASSTNNNSTNDASNDANKMFFSAVASFILLTLPFWLLWLKDKRQTNAWLGIDSQQIKNSIKYAFIGLVIVYGMIYGINLLGYKQLLQQIFGNVPEQESITMLKAAKNNSYFIVMVTISVVLLAPIAEEIFFRFLLFRGLQNRFGILIPALTSSCLFAIVHYNLFALLPLLIVALTLTWVYYRAQSIVAPIIMHAIFNFITVLSSVLL